MQDSITQSEANKRFVEFVKGKELNRNTILEYKVMFVKALKDDGLTIRAGFSVEANGTVTHESNHGED